MSHQVPFLFDARSYWIDEKLDEGRWFTNPIALGIARGLEHRFYADAAGVVTLTELQAGDIRGGKFGAVGDRSVVCIPTCADYEEFALAPPPHYRNVPSELVDRLRGKLVLGFIGSINRSYMVNEAAVIAAEVLRRRPDSLVLATSPQHNEYVELFSRHGLPTERTLIQSVDHRAMAEWLSLVTWGLLLIEPTPAKRASMPTKLAEFFASGVRVAHFGCNSEVGHWVVRAGGGITLTGTTPKDLSEAAVRISESEMGRAKEARDRTRDHFSLAAGISRYNVLHSAMGLST